MSRYIEWEPSKERDLSKLTPDMAGDFLFRAFAWVDKTCPACGGTRKCSGDDGTITHWSLSILESLL